MRRPWPTRGCRAKTKQCKYDSIMLVMKYISIIKCCGSGLMSGSRHFLSIVLPEFSRKISPRPVPYLSLRLLVPYEGSAMFRNVGNYSIRMESYLPDDLILDQDHCENLPSSHIIIWLYDVTRHTAALLTLISFQFRCHCY
jgi:hypothetical protein